jgi:pimeloyl-ACP methyl ester carboxylesterase
MSSPNTSPAAATLAFGHSPLARAAAGALRAAARLLPGTAARLAVNLFFTPLPTKLSTRRPVPSSWRVERHHRGADTCTLLHHGPPRPAGDRPRVLLVHGWAGDALQMRVLGEALHQVGFEPVLMDLPAHGRSPGWRCTMPQIVRSLSAAQTDAGPFHAIVAHSMGAVASLHAIACGLPIASLVALAPSSTPASVLRWFGEAFALPADLIDRMRTRIERHEQMRLEQFEPPWLTGRVNARVLLIHDRDDRMAPVANSQALHRALPGARFEATEGLSHRRLLTDPGVIERVQAHLLKSLADSLTEGLASSVTERLRDCSNPGRAVASAS